MNCVFGSGRSTKPALSELAERRQEAAAHVVGHILIGDAADQEVRQLIRREFGQPRPDLVAQARADEVIGDLAVQHPVTALGYGDHLGEQVLQLEDLDVVVLDLRHEIEVVASRLLQPDHVVEQQLVAVLRGQSLVGEPWCAHQDPPQLSGLGPDSQSGFGRHSTARFPVTSIATATTDVSATTPTTTSSALVKVGSRLSLRAQM